MSDTGGVEKITVVVADDHRLTAHSIADSLKARGYQISAVTYGVPDALAAIAEHSPQVLISDLDMGPGPTGADLIRFLNNWRGLVDINSNLHTVIVPDHLHPAINTVVMDAVNDAIRHGHADWIDVRLEIEADHVVLTVSNNGAQLDKVLASGMGGATLDRLATGGWSREPDALGFTRLTARFSLA